MERESRTPAAEPPVESAGESSVDPPIDVVKARLFELELELKDLRGELERSERRVEAMKQIGRALGSTVELDPLLAEIVERTSELLEADRTTLFLLDRKGRELWSKVLQGDEVLEIRLPFGVGVVGWVAEHGVPQNIKDAYTDARFNAEVDLKSGYRTRTILAWPIRAPHNSEIIGVIQVLNKRRGVFTRDDERLIEAIASEIGVALEVATLFAENAERTQALVRTQGELSFLLETERAISHSASLDEMLASILKTALQTMKARSGAIYVCDSKGLRGSESGCLTRAAFGGARGKIFPRTIALKEESIVADVVRYKEKRRGDGSMNGLLALPIRSDESSVMGVFCLVHGGRDLAFDAEEERSISAVTAQAGRAIDAERRRRERERSERLTTIGRMLAGVVHDLKTPMTLISGYSEMMAEAKTKSERAQFARLIGRQIDNVSSMTKGLLSFARGERTVLIRKVHVRAFMDEMQAELQQEFEGTSVSLVVDVDYRGAARFDETKLRRVFHNIARNAREAMPEGGTFSVVVRQEESSLVFQFADTGQGVPPELQGALFEPFATAGKRGGTGLGLAMVKQIAEEHRGTVDCESGQRGTVFTLRLPMDAPEPFADT
ncbi:MAG: GAF domain-containing protein [Deltaproteobacteria bacterium]|nr:GAF domain-containing protein [Deltaproteobacteria bacterium]